MILENSNLVFGKFL